MWSRPDTPGQYAFFNASVCPAGWVAANGANGTVDLRGEFIRGWDNGRGVDSGRSLAAWQKGTVYLADQLSINRVFGMVTNQQEGTPQWADATGTDMIGWANQVYSAMGRVIGPQYGVLWDANTGSAWGVSRPRNVALLACMKL